MASKITDPKAARAAMFAKAKAHIAKTTGHKPIKQGTTKLGHVSTGSFPVDMLIGGTPVADTSGKASSGSMVCPGFPRRRITELYGPESSGKTTLLISAMVQAQRAGGMVMFIDFEHALDLSYAQRLGLSLDEDKWAFYQPDNMEQGFTMIFLGIMGGVDMIGVDSVAAMVPKDEMAKGFEDAVKIGAVARQFSVALPKMVNWLQKCPYLASGEEGSKAKPDPDAPGTALVFVNQTRALIQTSGGGHGPSENTSGGKALKFFAYLRISTQRIKSEFVERKDPMTGKKRRFAYGNVTDVKIVKSKILGKQGHSSQIFIRYGTGIDDYVSIIEAGVSQKLIKREGSYFILASNKEQKFQGRENLRKHLIANPKLLEQLKADLTKAIIASIDGASELEEDDEIVEGEEDMSLELPESLNSSVDSDDMDPDAMLGELTDPEE